LPAEDEPRVFPLDTKEMGTLKGMPAKTTGRDSLPKKWVGFARTARSRPRPGGEDAGELATYRGGN